MNPDGAPAVFGRTPAQALRGAVVLALLGTAAVAGFVRLLTNPATPVGAAFRGTGIPPEPLLAAGIAAVLALAVYGCFRSVRSADRFRITPEGLEVDGPFGRYLLAWSNIRRAEATPSDSLGIEVASRDAVLATHRGTEEQREWLRTMAPFAEWDFLFPRASLGHPAAEVLAWMEPYLRRRQA